MRTLYLRIKLLMILRERLAELLYRQSWNKVPEASLPKNPPWLREEYLEKADAIIAFFAEAGNIEAIDVIEAYGLGFHLGNAVKYILRAGRKTDNRKEDIEKAIWYLKRYNGQNKTV